MKQCFGYIRVSTAKQGQQGVSLPEQRDAISRYAERNSIQIVSWFEERETAAKRGRPGFNRMLKLLRSGQAHGVILHKIDRGARNLKDWADLGELIDRGIQVHLANESLDMNSRGGRLSADIQAVVAADYIRNLREETRKGFYGRLKQGLYPLAAPVGYLDTGKGKIKDIDPVQGPIVRRTFELYASGRFTLDSLGPELYRLGLRNKRGGRVSHNGLSRLLNNPFYIGVIHLSRTNQTFPGKHEPLVTARLFARVQCMLSGKAHTRAQKHEFLFRRLLQCANCGSTLIGEHQKGHTYYRCHTTSCQTRCIREEIVDQSIRNTLSKLRFNDLEKIYFGQKLEALHTDWREMSEKARQATQLALLKIQERFDRLTDAFVDGSIDRDAFQQRKRSLLVQKAAEEETLKKSQTTNAPDRVSEFLELAESALLSYEMANLEEKRNLLRAVTSNREADGKSVVVKLSFPFNEVANRPFIPAGDPCRLIPRTWDRILEVLATASERGPLPGLKPSADTDEALIADVSRN